MKITTEFDLLSRHGWITSDRKAAEVLVLAGSVILLFRWKGNFAWLDPFACATEKKYQSSRRRNVATVLMREILVLYTCLFCNWPCWLLCPYTDYHKSPIVFKDTSKIWDKNLFLFHSKKTSRRLLYTNHLQCGFKPPWMTTCRNVVWFQETRPQLLLQRKICPSRYLGNVLPRANSSLWL